MRTTWAALFLVLAVGCGSESNSGGNADANNNGADAKQFLDAPATQTAMVTVSGQATSRTTGGSSPEAGVTIQAFRNADENTPIATTTTDAQGNYSLTITLNGEAVDGFLKATKTGFLTTYLYPPYPLDMDFNMASVILVTQQTFETLSNVAGGGQMPGNGLIGLIVTDGTNPVGGATASSTPAASVVRYNTLVGNQVLPLGQTSTHTDGVAYLFNLPPGQVTVSAAKTGSTFASHKVKAWADQLTTTVIVP